MKFLKNFFSLTIFMLFVLTLGNISIAQEISVGTDIVNRYIWRGLDLGGNTPNIQPTVAFSSGGFTGGFWGAYSLSDPAVLTEIDIYASYSFALAESGSLSLGFTDYTNPNSGVKFGNFNNYDDPAGPGAHYVELNVGYSGPEKFPISLSFNYFIHNLENNPIYFQVGYSTAVKDIGLDLFVGGTPGEKNMYYGVKDFSLINIGFKAKKEIKISESFSVPLFGSIVLNGASEELFYLVGISL